MWKSIDVSAWLQNAKHCANEFELLMHYLFFIRVVRNFDSFENFVCIMYAICDKHAIGEKYVEHRANFTG